MKTATMFVQEYMNEKKLSYILDIKMTKKMKEKIDSYYTNNKECHEGKHPRTTRPLKVNDLVYDIH